MNCTSYSEKWGAMKQKERWQDIRSGILQKQGGISQRVITGLKKSSQVH